MGWPRKKQLKSVFLMSWILTPHHIGVIELSKMGSWQNSPILAGPGEGGRQAGALGSQTGHFRVPKKQRFSSGCSCGYGSIPIDAFLVGWTSINPSYFDVHQGYKVLTHCPMYHHVSIAIFLAFFFWLLESSPSQFLLFLYATAREFGNPPSGWGSSLPDMIRRRGRRPRRSSCVALGVFGMGQSYYLPNMKWPFWGWGKKY